MKIYNIGILILLSVVFISCKEKKNFIDEDFINLNPNKAIIKKQYNRYWTFNPFYPEDSLFTPIVKSKKRPNMPLGLIKGRDIYNLGNFYKYVNNNLDGNYTAYVYNHDKPLFRYYLRIYKDDQEYPFKTTKEIEEYFKKNKIQYQYLKYETKTLPIYLLKSNYKKDDIFCVIDNSKTNILEILMTYNVSDTIKSLEFDAFNPFSGTEIEK